MCYFVVDISCNPGGCRKDLFVVLKTRNEVLDFIKKDIIDDTYNDAIQQT